MTAAGPRARRRPPREQHPLRHRNLVDVPAAATARGSAELVDRLGVRSTAEIATAVYTGLVTDTGSFKFAATTPAGARVRGPAARRPGSGTTSSPRHLRHRELRLREAARLVCARAVLEPTRSAVSGWSGPRSAPTTCTRLGLALADVEGVIDVLRDPRGRGGGRREGRPGRRLAQGVDAVQGRGRRGCRLRGLGGGGHRFAAGFTVARSRCDRLGRLRAALAAAPHLPAVTAPDGLVVVDKPAGWTSPRRRRPHPPARRHPQGRARRHARPDGDRRARARHRPGDPAARSPGARPTSSTTPRSASGRPP